MDVNKINVSVVKPYPTIVKTFILPTAIMKAKVGLISAFRIRIWPVFWSDPGPVIKNVVGSGSGPNNLDQGSNPDQVF